MGGREGGREEGRERGVREERKRERKINKLNILPSMTRTIIPKNMIESRAPAWNFVGCTEVELSKTGVTKDTLDTSTESEANAQPHTEIID